MDQLDFKMLISSEVGGLDEKTELLVNAIYNAVDKLINDRVTDRIGDHLDNWHD